MRNRTSHFELKQQEQPQIDKNIFAFKRTTKMENNNHDSTVLNIKGNVASQKNVYFMYRSKLS